jgi:arylsulfatase A-like enzyme
VALAAPAASGTGAAAAAGAPPARPNILFVLADDLSRLEMRSLPSVRSLLMDEGTTFKNALVNVSLCCPSRATILRGQYAHNTRVLTNGGANGGFEAAYRHGIEQSTIATWLRDSGYRTGMFGKYLNGYPNGVANSYVPPGWDDWASPIAGLPYSQFDYTVNENGTPVEYGTAPGDYGTDVFVGKTESFMSRAATDGVPFFAFLSLYAPHNPATAAPRHEATFPQRAPRTPGFGEKNRSDKPKWLRDQRAFGRRGAQKADEAFSQRAKALRAVDEGIAALVATLERSGQLDRTFIVFASDNGYHFGQHGLALGKGNPYEEDVRIPLVVRGPGVAGGVVREAIVGNTDFAPTMAAMAGVAAPRFVDGRPFVPTPGAKPAARSRYAYLLDHWRETYDEQHPEGAPRRGALEPAETGGGERQSGKGKSDRTPAWHGLRTRRYKYVELGTGETELYDLRRDPFELRNVVDGAPDRLLRTLHTRLAALRTCRAARCRELEDRPIRRP